MIAPRKPAERDHAVRRDGLAGRAVYPDGVPVRIDRARTADVGEGKRGVDVHSERSAVRQQELWTLLWTLWLGTRARHSQHRGCHCPPVSTNGAYQDRKSTRLNSSHTVISYAVFCLKKKKKKNNKT